MADNLTSQSAAPATPPANTGIAARSVTYSGSPNQFIAPVGLVAFAGADGAKTATDIPGGGGVEANALRVTLANDSTGVLTVKQPLAANLNATVVGTVTANAGTGTFAISAASLPLPTSAATSTNQTNGSQKTQIVDGSGSVIGSTANALDINVKSGNIGGTSSNFTAAFPSLGTAVGLKSPGSLMVAANADSSGNLLVNVAAGSTGNAAASATGAAVPASADYLGVNIGGTLRGQTGVNPTGSVFAAQSDLTSVAGTTTDTNSGNKSAGTLRVVLATDQPQLTNALKVDGSAVTQPTSITGLSTILMGIKAVTTAGTRVTLASSTASKSVTIKAHIDNTGIIYVGDTTVASSNGFRLSAGDTVSLQIANLNTVNLDASVSGEGVSYIGIV